MPQRITCRYMHEGMSPNPGMPLCIRGSMPETTQHGSQRQYEQDWQSMHSKT